MAILTSESDSNTSETQCHLSYYFFSLTTDVNRVSQNPRVPAAQESPYGHPSMVRVHYFFTCCLLIPFRLQTMASPTEGDQWQMWEFIRI